MLAAESRFRPNMQRTSKIISMRRDNMRLQHDGPNLQLALQWRSVQQFVWRGVLVVAIASLMLQLLSSARSSEALSITFVTALTGPESVYWAPAIEAFRDEVRRRPKLSSIRISTIDARGRAEAVEDAVRSVGSERSNVVILGMGLLSTKAVVEILAAKPVVIISLANLDSASLALLQAKMNGRFFALDDLPASYVDLIKILMDTGSYYRKSIALLGDQDLILSLKGEVSQLERAVVVDQPTYFHWPFDGKDDWSFVIRVNRYSSEDDRMLTTIERAARIDQVFLGLSGPSPEIRGRLAAILLDSAVDFFSGNAAESNIFFDQLRKSELINPITGGIAVPWNITAYGLHGTSSLIEEVGWLWERYKNNLNPIGLCQVREDKLVVSYKACLSNPKLLK